jgi:hypothetical protein
VCNVSLAFVLRATATRLLALLVRGIREFVLHLAAELVDAPWLILGRLAVSGWELGLVVLVLVVCVFCRNVVERHCSVPPSVLLTFLWRQGREIV